MTIALILLALLILAVAGAAYYHLRTLEQHYDAMLSYQARQIENLRADLEAERDLREMAEKRSEDSITAATNLILMVSDAQSRQAEKIDTLAKKSAQGNLLFGRGLS